MIKWKIERGSSRLKESEQGMEFKSLESWVGVRVDGCFVGGLNGGVF